MLTLPATMVAWLTYGSGHTLCYPSAPLTGLLGLAGGLLLRWQRRPTAVKALLAGLSVAGTAATAA